MEGSGSQALICHTRRQNRAKPLCFLCVLLFKIFPLPIGCRATLRSTVSLRTRVLEGKSLEMTLKI